jgi:mono/diheme cytochrome c family protein
LLSALLLLAGCDSRPAAPKQAEYAPPGPVPASPQRPGDPAKGYRALVTEPYLGCGIPYEAWLRTGGADPKLPRLPDREGLNADLPYFFTATRTAAGVDLVVPNCLACHGGSFDGKLVIGLGNENLDFTADRSAAVEAAGAYVESEAAAAEWKRWADRSRASAPYEITDTVGVNPAIAATLALIAHRDPKTMAWSNEPLIAPPAKQAAPASVPPWWRLAKKNALYSNAEARGDQARAMMLGAVVCAEDVASLKKIDAYAPDMRAYFASLKPPAWPFGVKAELAAKGRDVFEKTCSGCHGTYGENPTYPNLVVALEQVGTDPLFADYSTNGESDRFLNWFNQSFFGEIAWATPARGYIAPPLDGVWVTAPFLHNGSVPTIAALLESSKRPRYWTRSFTSNAADYDPDRLGWRYTELPQGKAGTEDANARKKIYDTTLPGYANTGHTFGDHLSDEDRKAVLEYLKTI